MYTVLEAAEQIGSASNDTTLLLVQEVGRRFFKRVHGHMIKRRQRHQLDLPQSLKNRLRLHAGI